MKRSFARGTLYIAVALLVCALGAFAVSGIYDFNPPPDHTSELGPSGFFTAFHMPGYTDPVGSGCTDCHGDGLGSLDGGPGPLGDGPSCYHCHGDYWTYDNMTEYPENQLGGFGVDAQYLPYLANPVPLYPDSHTVEVSDIMPLSEGDSGWAWACWYCHPSIYGYAGPDKKSFFHAPGHGTPYESGCPDCHGPNLDGGYEFAISCRWCHQNQWVGDGLPPDHQNLTTYGVSDPAIGAELKGGFAWHRRGWDNPYSIYDSDTNSPDGCTRCHGPNLDDGFAPSCFSCHGPGGGPPASHTEDLGGATHGVGYEDPFTNGCTQCHGPNLNDGFASSCYTCHGPRWDPHTFAGEPWLPEGENHCYVCHLPPEFNPGTATSDPIWNHQLSSSTYAISNTTLAPIVQPSGLSAKCLGCHEGAPTGPAVDDYGTSPTQTYYVTGEEAFGIDLTHHHPVSLTYNSFWAADHGGLNNPSDTRSGRTKDGTIAEDMLEGELLQCTACHDQHGNSIGNYLYETPEEGLCFICHKFENPDPLQHHIPGRDDPWGAGSGSSFNCTMCHGADLAGAGEVPGCETCHNPFSFPDPPPPDHHGGDRDLPYFDCASCHADPLTGVVTGNDFGTSFAPSCYQCHDDFWADDNTAPDAPTMADLSGTVGEAVTFDASHIGDADGDPLAFEWNFGDGSPPGFPSHNPKTSHTYNDYGVFTATLAVTDGVAAPQYVQFTVTIEPATVELAADTWTVDVASTPAETFSITFDNHAGSLVGVKDDSSLAFGIEFVGVIFWMEMWMDLSGNVFWGTGDMYFGNVDRDLGTMEGVVFDEAGGVVIFSGTKP